MGQDVIEIPHQRKIPLEAEVGSTGDWEQCWRRSRVCEERFFFLVKEELPWKRS